MFGFIFGSACLLGLTATIARGHRGHAGAHRHHRGSGRWFLRRLLERLDTTPGQEKIIREAVAEVADELGDARRDFSDTRGALAQALRAPVLDRAALQSTFERHDEMIGRVRDRAFSALSRVHETLDARQRKILADFVEAGPFGHHFSRCH